MFQDEAGFGRINKPKYCWCKKGIRPSVPCHHIREYRYAFGAVEPLTGDNFFKIKDTGLTNIKLDKNLKKEEAFYNPFDNSITLSDSLIMLIIHRRRENVNIIKTHVTKT